MQKFLLPPSAMVAVAPLALGALIAAAPSHAFAQLRIDHAFARATPPGARTGGAYFEIENRGGDSDRLLRVSTPAAAAAEIHSMTMDGGVMTMRAAAALDDPAPATTFAHLDATTVLSPKSYHVMLLDLKGPLVAGETIPLTLTFEKAGVIEVPLRVEAMGATGK